MVWRWGKRESIYLSLHCHRHNEFCIKVGSDERHSTIPPPTPPHPHLHPRYLYPSSLFTAAYHIHNVLSPGNAHVRCDVVDGHVTLHAHALQHSSSNAEEPAPCVAVPGIGNVQISSAPLPSDYCVSTSVRSFKNFSRFALRV